MNLKDLPMDHAVWRDADIAIGIIAAPVKTDMPIESHVYNPPGLPERTTAPEEVTDASPSPVATGVVPAAVTVAQVEARIAHECFTIAANKCTTTCVMTLDNGWTEVGTSSVAISSEFSVTSGQISARRHALMKMVDKCKFHAREQAFQAARESAPNPPFATIAPHGLIESAIQHGWHLLTARINQYDTIRACFCALADEAENLAKKRQTASNLSSLIVFARTCLVTDFDTKHGRDAFESLARVAEEAIALAGGKA